MEEAYLYTTTSTHGHKHFLISTTLQGSQVSQWVENLEVWEELEFLDLQCFDQYTI